MATPVNRTLKAGTNQLSEAFRARVSEKYRQECLAEPSFTSMKAVPAAQDFISHYKAPLTFRKIDMKSLGSTYQKAILLLDEGRQARGIIRWIRGQGDPFFHHLLGEKESVESVLARVPVPIAAETPAPAAATVQRPAEYRIIVSKSLGYGEFRIPDTQVHLEKVAREFLDFAPSLSVEALKARFDALKSLSEARDFMAGFRSTKLHYELAGQVETWLIEKHTPQKTGIFQKRLLTEAAVSVMTESNQLVAVMRWVRDQGNGFFQNLLSGAEQQVDSILSSIAAAPQAAEVK